jgi:hypothetical protein
VPDRPVGAVLVVVSAPILQLLPGVGKAQEPVRIEARRPRSAVEGPREGIVGRLPGTGEVERGAPGVRPEIEIPGYELRTLIVLG